MDFTKLKVAELKEQLRERGLDTSGLKADLVQRLVNATRDEGTLQDNSLPAEVSIESSNKRARLDESPPPPLPLPSQTFSELLAEYPDEDGDFEVVVQGVQQPLTNNNARIGEDATNTADGGHPSMPAFRFSTLSTALTVRSTVEQEEALRITGVTASNYWMKVNPGSMVEGSKKKAFEIDLDEIEHAKWRDPGAVVSDFFNYGMNEHTWKEYAARQVALKLYRQQNILNKATAATAASTTTR